MTLQPPAPGGGAAADTPVVRGALKPGTLRTYNTHFRRLETEWSHRRLTDPAKLELEVMAETVRGGAAAKSGSTGTGAVENFVSAARCIYRYAEDHGWITPANNPSRKITMPARGSSGRYAIPPQQLAQINHAAAATGNDPELDCLILRLHTETACRRGGALDLRPRDLDPDQCLILLREKGKTERWQPVSPTLMQHLLGHARERRGPASEPLLHYRNGRHISSRRYDHL